MNIVSLNFDHHGNEAYGNKTGTMIISLLYYVKYRQYSVM